MISRSSYSLASLLLLVLEVTNSNGTVFFSVWKADCSIMHRCSSWQMSPVDCRGCTSDLNSAKQSTPLGQLRAGQVAFSEPASRQHRRRGRQPLESALALGKSSQVSLEAVGPGMLMGFCLDLGVEHGWQALPKILLGTLQLPKTGLDELARAIPRC